MGTLGTVEIAKLKVKVRRCQVCHLALNGSPVAPEIPSNNVRVLVLVDGPDNKEAQMGRAWVGPSARLMRALVGNVLVKPGIVRVDEIAWGYVASCYTDKLTKGEIGACRGNLGGLIEVCQPEVIILCGKVAMESWRRDLLISQWDKCMGIWGAKRDEVCVPMIHPNTLLQNRDPLSRRTAVYQLENVGLVLQGMDWRGFEYQGCCKGKCAKETYKRDKDGVPYCRSHWKDGGGTAHGRERNKWRKEEAMSLQTRLL